MTLFLVILSFTEMSRQDKSQFNALGNRLTSAITMAASSLSRRDHGLGRDVSGGAQQSNIAKASSTDLDAASSPPQAPTTTPYYSIRLVDADSGRGIPLVYLRSEYKSIYVTDSAGYVAFNEPELMTGQGLWLNVASFGYQTPMGGFDTEGLQVYPSPGGSVEIRLQRTQVAERLYRMTGYGIYRDSVLLGQPTPLERPIINAQVTGSDTVQCAKYQGKLLWMWQDTDQLAFPLGNFNMTGATTDLPDKIDPEKGIDFHYLTSGADNDPDTFVRSLAEIPLDTPGSYPIWVDGLTVVPDEDQGVERLVARYYASGPNMECIEEGLVEWNDATKRLDKITKLPTGCGGLAPMGHTYYVRDNGTRYAYYGKNIRVKADYASARDPSQYEAFTCLSPDGTTARRAADGTLIWGWVKGGKAVNYENTNSLVSQGLFSADESPYRVTDVDSGKKITIAQVGIAWNPYLGLWVNIMQELLGDTTAGEIWFATARAPEGPWAQAKKVATHFMNTKSYQQNSNDLYNPVQHYELMADGGRLVYFSGTFVNTFSGNPWSTPYYHYNNIMYRLDLNESSLNLPAPPPALREGTTPDEW